MITKWFKNAMNAVYFGGILSDSYCYDKIIKDRTGTIYYASHSMIYNVNFVANTNQGVVFGTGNTPATDEDVDLENQITSGITVAAPVLTKGMDGTKCFITLRYVVSNTTNADIVIKEVGLRGQMRAGTSVGSTITSAKYFLIDRTVLATPLTVPASSNAVLEYTLESDWDLT